MAKITKGECDRCEEYGEGRYKWMIYHINYWSLIEMGYELLAHRKFVSPIAREFHCKKCQKYFNVMAVIFWVFAGGTILLIFVLTALAYASSFGWI